MVLGRTNGSPRPPRQNTQRSGRHADDGNRPRAPRPGRRSGRKGRTWRGRRRKEPDVSRVPERRKSMRPVERKRRQTGDAGQDVAGRLVRRDRGRPGRMAGLQAQTRAVGRVRMALVRAVPSVRHVVRPGVRRLRIANRTMLPRVAASVQTIGEQTGRSAQQPARCEQRHRQQDAETAVHGVPLQHRQSRPLSPHYFVRLPRRCAPVSTNG